jgi:hypothetical protein
VREMRRGGMEEGFSSDSLKAVERALRYMRMGMPIAREVPMSYLDICINGLFC